MAPGSIQKMASGIVSMPDALTSHDPSSVASVNLHSNKICHIDGLQQFSNLRHLNLSSNRIDKIIGLTGLVNLESLNLSANRIVIVTGLNDLINLKKLLLSYNEITSLVGLGSNCFQPTDPCLHTLELHGNHIADFEQLHSLEHLHSLRCLSLRNESHSNPICSFPNYGIGIRQMLPQITLFDSGAPIVNTPRIDNAMQLVRGRSRPSQDFSLPTLEHIMQEARIESLESKLDIFMAMQASANKQPQLRQNCVPGEPTPPTSERSSSTVSYKDAQVATEHHKIETKDADVLTDQDRTEFRDALVGSDVKVEYRDVQVLTDHLIGQVDAAVSVDYKVEMANAEVLTDEDVRLLNLQAELQNAHNRFAALESSLRNQLTSAHDFIKESARQTRETMAEIGHLKEREMMLSKELESSQVLIQKLQATSMQQKEAESEQMLKMKMLQQTEVSLQRELDESRRVIERLEHSSNEMRRQYENELEKLKRHQFDLESNCQKLSQDRAALKELTKSALQKQKQLCNEIEMYKHWKERHTKEHEATVESYKLQINDLKRQLSTSDSRADSLSQKEALLTKELQSAKSALERQSVQISNLTERLNLNSEENQDLQSQLQHLKESGVTSMKILEDHSLHIKELKRVIKELNKEKDEWRHIEDSLCQRIEDYRERCHDAENGLRECQEIIESSRTQTKEFESAVRELQKEIERRDLAKASIEDELKGIRTRYDKDIESLSQEITSLKAKLKESESATIESQSKARTAETLVVEANLQRDTALTRVKQVESQMRVLLSELELRKQEARKFARIWAS